MHGFRCQQEAAEDLFAVLGVATSRESAQIAAQMFEPAFTQVRRAQTMAPLRWEVEKRQHLFQLALKFLHHLWRGPPPARTESPRPVPRLRLVLRVPNPPELPPEFAPLEPCPSRRQRFQVPKPMRQTALLPSRGIHHLRRTDDRGQSVTHDQYHRLQPAFP